MPLSFALKSPYDSNGVESGVPGVTAGKFTVSHYCFVIKGLQWSINRSDAAGLAGQYGDMPLSV